jgi:hypothetical protein
MTLARVKSTGSGAVRFAVAIEGIKWILVSDDADASINLADTSGRQRIPGLKTDGWVFSEKIDLIAAKHEAEPVTVTIADVGGYATRAFDTAPTFITYLSADLTDSDETVNVLDTSGFVDMPALVYIGTETLLCDGSTGTTLGSPGNTTRAYLRSYATYHYQNDGTSTGNGFTPVSNQPIHFEGRRVEFFAYDSADTLSITTDGSGQAPFWTGIISTEPKFDGVSWSFAVDPITSRLKQKIGAQLGDPVSIRGIYYPESAPFTLKIVELAGAYRFTSSQTAYTAFAMAGFWETQDDFVAALNAQIINFTAGSPGAISGAFTQSVYAVVASDGSLAFKLDTSASPHFLLIGGLYAGNALSPIDGIPADYVASDTSGPTWTVAASTTYDIPMLPQPGLAGHGSVPRAHYGRCDLGAQVQAVFTSSSSTRLVNIGSGTYPDNRIYLGGSAPLGAGTAVTINWQPNGGGRQISTATQIEATSVNASSRYIDTRAFVIAGDWPGDQRGLVATASNAPEIRLGIALNTGTLRDMLTDLTNHAAQWAPLGALPMLRPLEFAEGDLAEAASVSPLGRRRWLFFSEHDLEELVQQECRLIGVYPAIDEVGRITFKRVRFGAPGEAPDATLDASDFLHEHAKFYSYERAPYGLVNLWTLKTGYDALEDKHGGPEINVIDVESRSNSARTREMKVAPFSTEEQPISLGDMITEAQKLAANVLGVFGGAYKILTCRVPLTRMLSDNGGALTVGAVTSITWAKPPNGDGTKGMSAKIGVIVGKSLHIRSAYIELSILLTEQRVAGYSPGAKITGISGTSGTTGPFTVNVDTAYLPVGTDVDDFWQAGDKIRVFKWNNSAPGTITATLSNVVNGSHSLIFTADSSWTHTGSTWCIGSQVSTSVSSSKQKQYAYIATAAGLADFSDADISPYTLA